MVLHVVSRRGPFRGTTVVVPPWKTDAPALVERFTDLLAGAGQDVWLVVPPEHMERASPGAPSGHRFATLDLPRFRAIFEQLVVEIRTALAMAAARGPAGLLGLSLGALAGSLAIGGREAPAFAALVAPPADLAGVLATTAIGRRYRRLATAAGSAWPGFGELRAALAPFDPARRPPPPSATLLAIGRYDRIALPEAGLALARAWGVPPRLYPRGHLTLLFRCRALLQDLRRFVRDPACAGQAAAKPVGLGL
jgi:hypothetical protein